jgi:apolipoprotein N-acyltransferase
MNDYVMILLAFPIFAIQLLKDMNWSKSALIVLSGLLFGLSWPYVGSMTSLIFIAFVPLLIVEDDLYKKGKTSFWAAFKSSYVAFLLFNLITTFWIYNVEESLGTKLFSAGSAITINAAFMTIAFSLFHVTRVKIGSKQGYISLLLYWIAWEYLHLNWEFSWPWLTLGNVFSIHPNWVQWYEFTGFLGGTTFIIITNLLLFFAYQNYVENNKQGAIKKVLASVFLVLLSYSIGFTCLITIPEKEKAIEIVLVQPNVNPYTEKFQYESSDVQLLSMLELAEEKISEKTRFVLFPETALQERTTLRLIGDSLVLVGLWENNIEASNSLRMIRTFLDNHSQLTLIFGVSSDRLQEVDEEKVNASRYLSSVDRYYQSYNAALLIEKDKPVAYYYKSELVPAVEFMPYQWLLQPLADLAIDMGGTTGTLGTQEKQTPFVSEIDTVAISPSICYESIYAEVSAEFVNNGAQILGIITNDGWWGDSPGFKQHVSFARLRAIESRKWVARSANTGISCFINPKGEVVQESNWWVKASLVENVYPNDFLTFYVRHGAYIGRLASFLSILLLIYTFVNTLRNRQKSLK